jgi:hypothetical protein
VAVSASVGAGVLDGTSVGAAVAAKVGVSVGSGGVLDGATVDVATAVFVACGDGKLVSGAAGVSVGAGAGIVAVGGALDVAFGATPCDDAGVLTVMLGVAVRASSAAARVVVAARLSAVCVAPILSSSILTLFGK